MENTDIGVMPSALRGGARVPGECHTGSTSRLTDPEWRGRAPSYWKFMNILATWDQPSRLSESEACNVW
jgi:hypothetical protein